VNEFYSFLGLSHLRSRSASGSIYKLLNTLHVKATGRGAASLTASRSGGSGVKSPTNPKTPRDEASGGGAGKKGSTKGNRSGSVIEEELSDPLTEEDVEAVIAYRCLKAVACTHAHTLFIYLII
jgi:hypothetical protein